MNEYILFIFLSVVNDGVISDSNRLHPTTFTSKEECTAMTTDESRTHIYRYLTEETMGTIIDMRFECVKRVING
mgnify:CR=1 FL=1|jgi:hypothetical protein